MSRHVVDLNSDLGEGIGRDNEILELVSSANIACGFHAGSPASVLASIRAAIERGVAVGAHPSFPDRENFGRTNMRLSPEEVFALVSYQVGAFQALCHIAGARMNHVKAHGALYNMAAVDRELADAIARAVREVAPAAILFVPPNSALQAAADATGVRSAREVFADRNYMPDGTLVSRGRPDALLHDPKEAGDRVVRMLREGVVRAVDGTEVALVFDTICLHGDSPEAVEFARELRDRLQSENISIDPPG